MFLAGAFFRLSPAEAVSCAGSNLFYVETGNGGQTFGICGGFRGWGVCQQPVLGGPSYSLNHPGCSPYFGSCAMTATLSAEFPGNYQNDPGEVGFS